MWFYLSFAGDTGFRGACVVEADEPLGAVVLATIYGINPGGEVMMIGTEEKPPLPTYKLLSKEDIGEGKTLGELEDEGYFK